MEFDSWLSQRLLELNTDEATFGPYIKGLLESEEDIEQKIEDLDEILSDLVGVGAEGSNVESLRKDILTRWNEAVAAASEIKVVGNGKRDDAERSTGDDNDTSETNKTDMTLDQQLEKLLHLSPEKLGGPGTSAQNKVQASSVPDFDLRSAILSRYHEADLDTVEAGPKPNGLDGVDKNTNAERVLNNQKEMKEKAKAEAAKKRERDKEDRARQKKLAEDKKEKAKKKATKVERKC